MDNRHLFSFPSLKMLVVLYAAPVATPTETERIKRLFAEIFFVNLVWEVLASVHIVYCCRGSNARASDAGVLQGVDVDGHSKGMLRKSP